MLVHSSALVGRVTQEVFLSDRAMEKINQSHNTEKDCLLITFLSLHYFQRQRETNKKRHVTQENNSIDNNLSNPSKDLLATSTGRQVNGASPQWQLHPVSPRWLFLRPFYARPKKLSRAPLCTLYFFDLYCSHAGQSKIGTDTFVSVSVVRKVFTKPHFI